MSNTHQTHLARHVLPPGFEQRDHTIYGYFYVEVEKIVWLKGVNNQLNTKLKVKFWGDRGTGQVLRPVNATAGELQHLPTTIEYEIRCPMVHFQRYLEDCTHLKFEVFDARGDRLIGVTTINLQFYLKHK